VAAASVLLRPDSLAAAAAANGAPNNHTLLVNHKFTQHQSTLQIGLHLQQDHAVEEAIKYI
jgi:hypothetical protein